MTKELNADDTILGLAAAVTSRACELITDGWTKGSMMKKSGGAPVSFCIHGAVEFSMEETFGVRDLSQRIQRDVEQVAVAFICDAAFGTIKGKEAGIPAASFNDASERRHDEVIRVMQSAADRLWSIALDSEKLWEPSKWADVDVSAEPVQQFLHASLTN